MDENEYQAQQAQEEQLKAQRRAQAEKNFEAVVDSFSTATKSSREDIKKDKEAINKRANNN